MGKHLRDLTGQSFERWTVIKFDKLVGHKPRRRTYWLCKCQCGVTKSVWMGSLVTGMSKSCGCWKRDHPGAVVHGLSKTASHGVWLAMRQRCHDPNAINYGRYGGRGITVCARWNKFENFFADMGERPPGAQLDRIDNSLGYSPDNCRWITSKENNRNTRRNVRLTYNGKTLTMAEWAERTGLSKRVIAKRLRKEWPVQKILTVPKTVPNEIIFNGHERTLSQWAAVIGISVGTLRHRLRDGWSVTRAFTEYLHSNHGRKP